MGSKDENALKQRGGIGSRLAKEGGQIEILCVGCCPWEQNQKNKRILQAKSQHTPLRSCTEMLALSFIFFSLVLCLLVVQLVRLQFQRRRYPSGPTPLPFIGCLWHLKFLRLNREHLTEMSKIYGNIFTLWFGPYPVIILQGFQAVKDGLTTHPEDVAGRPLFPLFKAMANNKGIVLATGQTWKHQRRFSMATLKVLGMGKSSLQYQIQEEAEKLVEEFRKSEGKPMNPYLALNLAVSNVICALVFGRRFSTEDETFHRLLEAIEKIFSVAGCVTYNVS
ncbi:hypothetical protein Chor_014534 [Crotalus horridus]